MKEEFRIKINKRNIPPNKFEEMNFQSEDFSEETIRSQTIITDARTQFAFIGEASTITTITELISNYGINLDGFLLLTIDNKSNVFKFVVGESTTQSEFEVETVRCLLKDNDINFCEKIVLKLFYPYHTPDTFSSLYAGLSDALNVISIYTSTDNDIYLETSALEPTIKILSTLD